jgi:hypothetical protein
LKLKIKLRRRRTSNQQQVQEEKDKPRSKSRRRRTSPGAEPGGEGKQGASHHLQQAFAADNNILAAKLQATGRTFA